MTKNEGTTDRRIRLIAGLILIGFAVVGLSGTGAVVAGVLGTVAVVTGFFGWCPAYSVFGISTCRTDTGG